LRRSATSRTIVFDELGVLVGALGDPLFVGALEHRPDLARSRVFGEAHQLATAKTFLFDGSDMAPSALGGDYLFSALQDLVTHPNDVDRIAQGLENFAKSAY